MPRWAFRSDDALRALGADPLYTGMDLGEVALPVVTLDPTRVIAPLYANGLFRIATGPFIGQFSVIQIIAPNNFGIWIQNVMNEAAAGNLLVGASQNESSTPILTPTAALMVLINSQAVRANFNGAALGLVTRYGSGTAASEPVASDQTNLVSINAESSLWQPVWLPAGRHFWIFSAAVNTTILVSVMLAFPDVFVR